MESEKLVAFVGAFDVVDEKHEGTSGLVAPRLPLAFNVRPRRRGAPSG
jgi:hypothetical protein